MIDMHRAFKKAKKLDLSDWRRLGLLCIGAFLLGMNLTFLEVGSVSLFLQRQTFHAIGVDFLGAALLLVWGGSLSVKLNRRHGYGGGTLTAFLTLGLSLLFYGIISFPGSVLPANFLFIYKYLMFAIVGVSFWTIVSRFVVQKFDSLKYQGLLAASLLGFYWGGVTLSRYGWTPEQALLGAIYGFIILTILMKLLTCILPQPAETFVRTAGGQDASERKMVDCILLLAFTYTTAKVLGDYLLYRSLTPNEAFSTLAWLWMVCGGSCLLALLILSQLPFLYTTFWGLIGLSFGFFFLAEGAFLEIPWLLNLGFIIAWVCCFLYWNFYLSLLPRPLVLGEGMRLRKKRQMLMEPLGFVLTGALILTVPQLFLAPILGLLSLVLMILLGISVLLYNQLLRHLCKMQSWCNGPLMLMSSKLIHKIKEGTKSTHLNEAIYFLRVMENAYYPGLQKQLVQALSHPLPGVRLFALDKLDTYGLNQTKVVLAVSQIFQNEKDSLVKARALAFLIHHEGEYNPSSVYHKYGAYLDDEELKIGAILGFLQAGGEWALLAMDGLQQMVSSSQKTDNLFALAIIDRVPQEGLVRLVTPLLKSPHLEVVRSALLTAGRIGHTQNLSFVFQSLDQPDLQEEAVQALSLYGKKVFPPLEKMLSNPHVSIDRRKALIAFLGLLHSGEGKQVLLRSLYLWDIKLRREVLKAVLHSKIIWVARQRQKILQAGIEQDVKWWHLLSKNIRLCTQVPVPALNDSFSFLRRSFEEMRQDLRELILGQLILLKPNSLVKKAVAILRRTPSQRFISAVGILQDLLPQRFYRLLKPVLLAPIADTKEEKVTPMDVADAKQFLEQLILNPRFPIDRWMEASALYGLQKIGDEHSEIVLDKAFSSIYPVVLEAAMEVLMHLKPNKKDQEEYLTHQLQQTPKKVYLASYLNKRRTDDYV